MKGAAQTGGVSAAVWLASIASGALVAQHVAGKATRDTLFLTHFDLAQLPAAMIGAALVSLLAVVGFSRVLAKYGPARVVPLIFGSATLLFLAEWWLSLHSARGAAVAVYVHTAIFSSAAVSAFWSLVNERFDPHVAKKVVGRIASGGTIGGVVGGLVAWRAAAHLSVPMMLSLLAAFNAIGMLATRRLTAGVRQQTRHEPEPDAGGGWKITRETPYLRDLALLVLAGAVLQALLDWLLSAHASETCGKGPRLLSFFALFNTVVGLLSFVAQAGLSRPVLQSRGLAGTLKSQPLTVVLTAALALASPALWSVTLLRGGEAVTRNSLYRSAYELFYTPLPTAKKRATKTLIDVGADRVGTTVGSVALLLIVHLGTEAATRVVLIASLALAALAWLVATRLQVGYVSALAASLKSGAVDLGDDDIEDLTTKKTLAETTALLDRDKLLQRIEQFQRTKAIKEAATAPSVVGPERVEASTSDEPRPQAPAPVVTDPLLARVAALRGGDAARAKAALAGALDASMASFAIPLLADDSVVRDAVRALRKIAPKATGQLLDALLDPAVDPRVRRRIPRVLKVCRTQRAASGLLLALHDPQFDVRVQVALALAQMHEEAELTFERESVFDIALHELTIGRTSWREPTTTSSDAATLHSIPVPAMTAGGDELVTSTTTTEIHRGLAHVFAILGLVLEREPLAIAHRAMRSDDRSLRGTAREYLEVVLPPRVRDVLLPLFGDAKRAAEARPKRETAELADELLRSSPGRARPKL